MASNTKEVPATVIGDHSANLFGGFTASYTNEGGEISEASPKIRMMNLNAKKLTGMVKFSGELNMDTPSEIAQIETLCGKGLSWYQDKAYFSGTGAGDPLGILNAPCLVTVEKEGGQAADTIMYENLVKMMGSMYSGSFQNSIWLAHTSTIPQSSQLMISVGTGGSFIPVVTESDGKFRILTREVIFTEKLNVLGDSGDIILANLSQYVSGLRGGLRIDHSIHGRFQYDELMFRIIDRHDGQLLWDTTLTLADGSTEVSPFVTLAART